MSFFIIELVMVFLLENKTNPFLGLERQEEKRKRDITVEGLDKII